MARPERRTRAAADGRSDQPRGLTIAIDIGGTFVDAVVLDARARQLRYVKVSATPERPSVGVGLALRELGSVVAEAERFVHGTTIGINAIIQRTGATTGIITNAGFRDVFAIGRGNVPDARQYDFLYEPPPPLVRREHTAGVGGRIDSSGRTVEALDEADVRRAARSLVAGGVTSIAICFLHSFRDPTHERRAAALVRETCPEVSVSIATDVSREHREYERTSTAALDAYIRPVVARYLGEVHRDLSDRGFRGRFLVMRSGGGAMTMAEAQRAAIHTVRSGPAGGVAGTARLARLLARPRVLAFDMGGTSLDVCLIERGQARVSHQADLDDHAALIPTFDVRSIGAGGGSIARVDRGLLRVGPESAGAVPGPICYRRGGTDPTVTDAAVCLGYIDPARSLDRTTRLDAHAARSGVERRLARPLGVSIEEAAAGVFDVLVAKTIGAVRAVTIERGHDVSDLSILAFGGAGPLVAPWVAREMGVREVIVPVAAATFSAWGMLSTEIVTDLSRTLIRLIDEMRTDELEAVFRELEDATLASLAAQGARPPAAGVDRQLELRFLGQAHALAVNVSTPLDLAKARRTFVALHTATYGHAMPAPVQILTARVRGSVASRPIPVPRAPARPGRPSRALLGTRRAYSFARRRMVEFRIYARPMLAPGDRLRGPALVDEGAAMTTVHEDQELEIGAFGQLLIRRRGGRRRT